VAAASQLAPAGLPAGHVNVGLGAPTATELVLGALSGSTGSVLADSALGGGVGYVLAPREKKLRYAFGTAVASGIGGVVGLALAVLYIKRASL